MRHVLMAALGLVILSCSLVAQPEKPPSAQELAETAARGRALAEYDQAAWHAGDAIEAVHPAKETIQRYVARKTPEGWIVAWGRFDDARTRFLISYEAKQGASLKDFTVSKLDPPIEDTDMLFHAAVAQETARQDFLASEHGKRPYNISVLPAASGQWYVYALPGQQVWSTLPYGGDVRYTISAEGGKIIERRQMHKTVLEEAMPAESKRPAFGFHSHFLSNVPEDSDVFYAMTRKAEHGEWVATAKYTY